MSDSRASFRLPTSSTLRRRSMTRDALPEHLSVELPSTARARFDGPPIWRKAKSDAGSAVRFKRRTSWSRRSCGMLRQVCCAGRRDRERIFTKITRERIRLSPGVDTTRPGPRQAATGEFPHQLGNPRRSIPGQLTIDSSGPRPSISQIIFDIVADAWEPPLTCDPATTARARSSRCTPTTPPVQHNAAALLRRSSPAPARPTRRRASRSTPRFGAAPHRTQQGSCHG